MPWWRRGTGAADTGPGRVPAAALPTLLRGERVLATAQEDAGGHWLVCTTFRLLECAEDGAPVLERGWHEVDTGAWDPDTWALSVAFVDRRHGRQWQLRERTGPGAVPQVFRERVSASVVLTRTVDLGPRRTARVGIRTELATRELLEQVVLGRGARSEDGELATAVATARREVRAQVGMPPGATTEL